MPGDRDGAAAVAEGRLNSRPIEKTRLADWTVSLWRREVGRYPSHEHQRVRTTLTLDDDIAAKRKAESRRAGRPFKEIVNETLRSGLTARRLRAQQQTFKITARDLGDLRPGLSLDNVAELVEQVEGSLHRSCRAL